MVFAFLILTISRAVSFQAAPKLVRKLPSASVSPSSLHYHSQHLSIALAVSDAERFAPKADPIISVVSGGILLGFFIIQSRVNRANELIRIIKEKKETFQKVKATLLNTDDPERILLKRDALQTEIENLEEDLLKAMTFLDIPNGATLRFRVLQPSETTLTEQQKREIEMEKIKSAVKDMSSESSTVENDDFNETEAKGDDMYKDEEERGQLTIPSIEKSTPFQRTLLFIGFILVTSLSSLLVTLMSDPITSARQSYVIPSSITSDESTTSSSAFPTTDSFKVREGVLESILREASQANR